MLLRHRLARVGILVLAAGVYLMWNWELFWWCRAPLSTAIVAAFFAVLGMSAGGSLWVIRADHKGAIEDGLFYWSMLNLLAMRFEGLPNHWAVLSLLLYMLFPFLWRKWKAPKGVA